MYAYVCIHISYTCVYIYIYTYPDIRCWSRFSKPDSAMEQAAVPSSNQQ